MILTDREICMEKIVIPLERNWPADWEEDCLLVQKEVKNKMKPLAVIAEAVFQGEFQTAMLEPGDLVFSVLLTIGPFVEEYGELCMKKGEYVKGMAVHALADQCLFQLDRQVQECLKALCMKRGIGIEKRLEAPSGLPMEAQRYILKKASQEMEQFHNKHKLPSLNSSHMFWPLKTMGILFKAAEPAKGFQTSHSCRNCEKKETCFMNEKKKIKITVVHREKIRQVEIKKGTSLLEALAAGKSGIPSPCGGKGSCGKCGIKLLKGNLPETTEDQKIFSPKERMEGMRLACQAYPAECCTISLAGEREFFHEQTGAPPENKSAASLGPVVIGIDLGTTTLAFQLAEQETGRALFSYTALNRQRVYGADVVSRIQAANQGKQRELTRIIRKDLADGIKLLLKEREIHLSQVKGVALAGNTTMIHLFMGYSCENLGVFPFQPVHTEEICCQSRELLSSLPEGVPLAILPGFSAFVGGDIGAGLLACDFLLKDKPSLFLDLGTNGEMVLGNRDRILISSTAAGPAFEGGSLLWGTGSVLGAISHVDFLEKVEIKTIGNQMPPVGICGSGILEIMAGLLEKGYMDETGLLAEGYFETGFPLSQGPDGRKIIITQKDIREFQMAKAAIYAGIELLAEGYGIGVDEIHEVILAGGFGYHLRADKAMDISLLPKAFQGKVKAVGNSSLAGAVKYLKNPEKASFLLKKTVEKAEEIHLSNEKNFQERYLNAMYF